MGFLDRILGKSTPDPDASPDATPAAARDASPPAAGANPRAAGRLPEGVWPGIAPAGLPPHVDVHDPGASFPINVSELEGTRGLDRVKRLVEAPDTEPALRKFLAVVVAIAADLKRRDVKVTELMRDEPSSPWSALPFVPIVVEAPAPRAPASVGATAESAGDGAGDAPSGADVVEVPVLVNPVPVTEREFYAFLVFAGHVRRDARFSRSPIGVYGPSSLPAHFARLADAELPGLLEGDLAPKIVTKTPTPTEGARAFAEVMARRARLHLDGSVQSLDALESLIGQYSPSRFGTVARVGIAAYVGEVAAAHAGASWSGKLPLARLRFGDIDAEPLEVANHLLPEEGPPRLSRFIEQHRVGAAERPE